jgi:hypothetical protein
MVPRGTLPVGSHQDVGGRADCTGLRVRDQNCADDGAPAKGFWRDGIEEGCASGRPNCATLHWPSAEAVRQLLDTMGPGGAHYSPLCAAASSSGRQLRPSVMSAATRESTRMALLGKRAASESALLMYKGRGTRCQWQCPLSLDEWSNRASTPSTDA